MKDSKEIKSNKINKKNINQEKKNNIYKYELIHIINDNNYFINEYKKTSINNKSKFKRFYNLMKLLLIFFTNIYALLGKSNTGYLKLSEITLKIKEKINLEYFH